MSRTGLVLSGGGARAAFQVGVLKAIQSWQSSQVIPFDVITGTSAGSINAAYLAANADRFHKAAPDLVTMWGRLTSNQVYISDIIGANHAKTMLTLIGLIRNGLNDRNCIFNAMPLARLIARQIDFNRIQHCLDRGSLHSVSISAINYHQSVHTTFTQSNHACEWQRVRRVGIHQDIKVKHLMASTAIPFLFSPVTINQQAYGDGSLKNFLPLSPSIQCGATRLVVIGVLPDASTAQKKRVKLSLGDVLSNVLNIMLFDSLDEDFEQLSNINDAIRFNDEGASSDQDNKSFEPIDGVIVRPSVDFRDIAGQYRYESPPILDQLLRLMGLKHNDGDDLRSYLMFEPGYLNALIEQGYRDAHDYRDTIFNILNWS